MLCVLWVDLVTTPIAAYYRQKDVLPAIRTPGFRAPCPRSKLLTERCGYTKQIEKTNVSLCRFFLFEFSWLARSYFLPSKKSNTMSDDEQPTFESGDAGGSLTYPQQVC